MALRTVKVPTVVIGNGGHAKVVVSALRMDPAVEVLGLLGPARSGTFGGLPLLGEDSDLAAVHARGVVAAFIAVGDNDRRRRLFCEAEKIGFELPNAVHPRATVDATVRLGRGLAIMAGAVINTDCVIGDNSIINTGATVDHDCHIAHSVHVGPGVHLSGYVSVGAGTLIGIGAIVGRGRPLRIGESATVGSGAVVVRDVASGSTVVGVPARKLEMAAR